MQLVEHLAHMSRKSPIYDSVGCELDGEATEALQTISKSPREKTVEQASNEWKSRHATETCSLKIVQDLASAQAKVNAHEYRTHIVDYVKVSLLSFSCNGVVLAVS
jgi:gamma-glutamyl phosphate reductase